jgi:hypothetical protein
MRKRDEWVVAELVEDGHVLVLRHTPSKTNARVHLPTRAATLSTPPPTLSVNEDGDFEVRLTTYDAACATRSRSDLETFEPFSARELSSARPASFDCSSCGSKLVDAGSVSRYVALPSEHWAELLEAWMCHADQSLSEDVLLANSGQRWPVDKQEILVASDHFVVDAAQMGNWSSDVNAKVRARVRSLVLFSSSFSFMICFFLSLFVLDVITSEHQQLLCCRTK